MSNLRQAAEAALEAHDKHEPLAVVMENLRAALADGDNLSPTGCDHCRHVLYAATKCKNCGRVTE